MIVYVTNNKEPWTLNERAGGGGGDLRNKTGGGGSCDKSDARHYDPAQILLIKVCLICLFNISEFIFIVAVFINKKIKKTMNHNTFILKEKKYRIQSK